MKYKTEFLLVLSHTGNVFFFFSHFFFFWSAVKMLSLISSGNSNSDQFYETFLARAKGCGQERERGKIWTHPGFLRFGLNWKPTFFFFFSHDSLLGSTEALLMTSLGNLSSGSHDPGWWLSSAACHFMVNIWVFLALMSSLGAWYTMQLYRLYLRARYSH